MLRLLAEYSTNPAPSKGTVPFSLTRKSGQSPRTADAQVVNQGLGSRGFSHAAFPLEQKATGVGRGRQPPEPPDNGRLPDHVVQGHGLILLGESHRKLLGLAGNVLGQCRADCRKLGGLFVGGNGGRFGGDPRHPNPVGASFRSNSPPIELISKKHIKFLAFFRIPIYHQSIPPPWQWLAISPN